MEYPSTLPSPDYTSYSGTVDQGLIRTSVPVPAPNQEIGFNSPRQEFAMTFSMTNDEYTDWIAWVNEFGYDWFDMPVVSQELPVVITSTHRMRMISDIDYVKRGDDWLSVSVAMEMVQNDPVDPLADQTRNYDVIVAGSPGSPSPDIIIAGSPDNPSTDLIIANLYNYKDD